MKFTKSETSIRYFVKHNNIILFASTNRTNLVIYRAFLLPSNFMRVVQPAFDWESRVPRTFIEMHPKFETVFVVGHRIMIKNILINCVRPQRFHCFQGKLNGLSPKHIWTWLTLTCRYKFFYHRHHIKLYPSHTAYFIDIFLLRDNTLTFQKIYIAHKLTVF